MRSVVHYFFPIFSIPGICYYLQTCSNLRQRLFRLFSSVEDSHDIQIVSFFWLSLLHASGRMAMQSFAMLSNSGEPQLKT